MNQVVKAYKLPKIYVFLPTQLMFYPLYLNLMIYKSELNADIFIKKFYKLTSKKCPNDIGNILCTIKIIP